MTSLILQTLQQLRDVYGDSVDKVIQGNAQPLDALIGTPDGWKRMGDIHIGDKVLTPYGDTTVVTGVYPKGVRPVYRVTLRDGSFVEVCNQHLWEIERYKTSLSYCGVDENGKKIYVPVEDGKTCKLIHEVIDTDELKRRVDKGCEINLPKIKPLSYSTKELPIHPYAMGVILGDANIDKKGYVSLSVNQKDNEILDRLQMLGYEFTRTNNKQTNKTPVYYVKNVAEIMRNLGLAGHRAWEKFIPEIYLHGDVFQRIALLQGIMDTDGTISKRGEMEFTSSSKKFAEDVQMLVRSLGGRVGLNVKSNVTYTSPTQKTKKKARPAYRVQNIRLSDINPFMLKRKAERWYNRTDNSGNRVVSVEYIRDDEVQCIRVADERHLYITDDCIPTHNTSNIVFLKSTDDSMLDTLQKMSGVTHRSYIDSKTVTRDQSKIWMRNEGKISYTMTTREVPVIAYNDMAFIGERNSMVFRAGDSPIWNRNETILPMSWRLLKDTIRQPGKEYTLQTIPTLSSAIEFDVRQNQPNFAVMLEKRRRQAMYVDNQKQAYQEAYGYTDDEIDRLDPDVYSDDIMEMVRKAMHDDMNLSDDEEDYIDDSLEYYDDNDEQLEATAIAQQKQDILSAKIYAGKTISKDMLIDMGGNINHGLDTMIVKSYLDTRALMENDADYFVATGKSLQGIDGSVYIIKKDESESLHQLKAASEDEGSKVFSEEDVANSGVDVSYIVTDAFYRFLVSLDRWDFAEGEFDKEMRRHMLDD